MFPQTAAQWHAVLNDFPSLLFMLALEERVAGHSHAEVEEHQGDEHD